MAYQIYLFNLGLDLNSSFIISTSWTQQHSDQFSVDDSNTFYLLIVEFGQKNAVKSY